MKLNSKQLRDIHSAEVAEHVRKLKRNPIFLILENVYDTYNIGGLFRLADALAVEKVYLCGEMDIPPHHKIAKASVGTYKIVPWVYKNTAKEAIEELRSNSVILSESEESMNKEVDSSPPKTADQDDNVPGPINIIAVEQSGKSIPFNEVEYTYPVALIVGNETYGVKPETLELVDKIVEIPMWGINKSLNVIVSAAIVSYWVKMKLNN